MSGGTELHLYCEHISSSHVHCNRHTSLKIGLYTFPKDAIKSSDWGIIDGEVRCEDHS